MFYKNTYRFLVLNINMTLMSSKLFYICKINQFANLILHVCFKLKKTSSPFKIKIQTAQLQTTPYICKPFMSGFWSLQYFKYPTHLATTDL